VQVLGVAISMVLKKPMVLMEPLVLRPEGSQLKSLPIRQ